MFCQRLDHIITFLTYLKYRFHYHMHVCSLGFVHVLYVYIFIFFKAKKNLWRLWHIICRLPITTNKTTVCFTIKKNILYWNCIQRDLQLPMQSVPITTKVSSSNPTHGEVYSMQHYVIKFVSDLRQVDDFLCALRFPPPIKLTTTI